jgi:hypothetical protein
MKQTNLDTLLPGSDILHVVSCFRFLNTVHGLSPLPAEVLRGHKESEDLFGDSDSDYEGLSDIEAPTFSASQGFHFGRRNLWENAVIFLPF